MTLLEGSIAVSGTFAYVAQQAWILNATLRDNILFGKEYDEERFVTPMGLLVFICTLWWWLSQHLKSWCTIKCFFQHQPRSSAPEGKLSWPGGRHFIGTVLLPWHCPLPEGAAAVHAYMNPPCMQAFWPVGTVISVFLHSPWKASLSSQCLSQCFGSRPHITKPSLWMRSPGQIGCFRLQEFLTFT